MKTTIKAALSALALTAALPAVAADLPSTKSALAPIAYSQSPWMVRVRAIGVLPQGGGSFTGLPAGYGLGISNSLVPELDITYFLTKNIALELILGVTPHTVKATGSIAALGNLVSTTALPPTLTLQYHFTDFGAFKPYIGVGVNWTHYFNTSVKNPAVAPVSISNSWGVAGQIGFDYMINQNWGFNVDVKKILMEPRVKLAGGAIVGNLRINPWIVGAGVTYRF
jgi:outer membrane protein